MADDIVNALQTANRSASVLQGIANPPQINPLAAINAANQAVQSEFQTRDWQAKQAVGQAYQGAINEAGEFDPNKFRALLSKSGPGALQAGAALLNTQNISSDELNQQKTKLEAYNSAVGSLMAMGDNVTHADVVAHIQNLMAHGMMTLPEAQRAMSTLPQDPAGLAAWVKQRALTLADASTRFGQTLGTRQNIVTPQETTNTTIPPPGGPDVTARHGQDPGAVIPGQVPYRADNTEIKPGETDTVHHWGPGMIPKAGNPSLPQGTGPMLTPRAGAGGGGGPGQTPILPNQPPVVNVPGRGNQIAPKFDPVTGQPLTYSSTPPPMPQGARPGGTGPLPTPTPTQPPTIRTGPPAEQQKRTEQDTQAYTDAATNYGSVITRAQNTAHAYDALRLLKDMDSTTGVGAAAVNTVRSRLAALGLLPKESVDILKLKDLFAKYTEKAMLDAAGPSTNLGKEMAQKSNAGENISTEANFEVLRNNLAKDLQTAAAYKSHEDKQGYGFLKHAGDVAETDPRGFVWNTYSGPEQAKIRAEAKAKGQAAVDALDTAIGMAHSLNVQVPGATLAPPTPGKGSFLMPPRTPAGNALLMTG